MRLVKIFALCLLVVVSIVPATTTLAAPHSIGSNIATADGTVYTIAEENNKTVKRPYTSAAGFLSYSFNTWTSVSAATTEDIALPTGSFIPPRDGTIFCSDRGTDKGTCYLITNKKKAGFTSEAIFKQLGFTFTYALYGDSSFLDKDSNIDSTTRSHSPGTLINKDGVTYLVTPTGLKSITDVSKLKSWGYWDGDIVPANTADKALSSEGQLPDRKPGQLTPHDTPPKTVVPEPKALSFTSESMPDGIAGKDYSYTFKAKGGTAPYTFENYSITHPCCYVSLKSSTGVFSNSGSNLKPLAGTWSVGIKVKDAKGATAQKLFTWKVVAESVAVSTLTFPSTTLPEGMVGQPYNNGVRYFYNGTGNITGSYGTLPPGFTKAVIMKDSGMSSGSVYLIGVPTQTGTYNVNFDFIDNVGVTLKKTFTIQVKASNVTCGGTPVGTAHNGFTTTVTSPNGCETFSIGSTRTITWDSSGDGNSVSITLRNSIGTAQNIASSLPDTGTYTWTVVNMQDQYSENTQYKIDVLIYHDQGTALDQSDNFFTIN